MEIIEKLIFEAKTNFALSLQQLMQLDENCIELINKKDELYSIITKYNNYFFARYNEYILLRTSSEDGKFIKEVETFNNTLFNTALSSSGDGEEGFYPDPQNNQKINISTNKYFPMFSIENVIDLPENSVFILLETFLNNYISELNSLYFGELEERTYYPGAEEDDPLNSWDNFTTVKENILDLFDALETNFNNIWTQINNAYNLIPSEYSTFFDFLSNDEKNDINKLTYLSFQEDKTALFTQQLDIIKNWWITATASTKKGNETTENTFEYYKKQLETIIGNLPLTNIFARLNSLLLFEPLNINSNFWNRFKVFISSYIDKAQNGIYYVVKNMYFVVNKLKETRNDAYNNLLKLNNNLIELPSCTAETPEIIFLKTTNVDKTINLGIKVLFPFTQISSSTKYTISLRIYNFINDTEIALQNFEGYFNYNIFTFNINNADDRVKSKNQYGEDIYLPILKNSFIKEIFGLLNTSPDNEESFLETLENAKVDLKIKARHDNFVFSGINHLPSVSLTSTLNGLSISFLENSELIFTRLNINL